MFIRPTWKFRTMLRSSWLMRSPYSVIGAASGTDIDATVMLGLTRFPTTQPCCPELPGHEVYRVVREISHTEPAPFGGLFVVMPLGPDTPVNAYCAAVPNR